MHENYETDFQKFYKIYPRADENISFLILSPFCTSPKRMWRSGLVPQKNYSSCLFLTKPYRLGILVGFHLPDWYSYMKSRGCISWGTSPEKGVSVTMQEAFTKLTYLFLNGFGSWLLAILIYLRYTHFVSIISSTWNVMSTVHQIHCTWCAELSCSMCRAAKLPRSVR